VLNNGTSIALTYTHLSRNVYRAKWTVSAIRGNRSNILPLQYIHFNFQPVFSLHYPVR